MVSGILFFRGLFSPVLLFKLYFEVIKIEEGNVYNNRMLQACFSALKDWEGDVHIINYCRIVSYAGKVCQTQFVFTVTMKHYMTIRTVPWLFT